MSLSLSLFFTLFTSSTLAAIDELEYLDGPSIPHLQLATINKEVGEDAVKYVATFADHSYLSCTQTITTQKTTCIAWIGASMIGTHISNAYFDILAYYFKRKPPVTNQAPLHPR